MEIKRVPLMNEFKLILPSIQKSNQNIAPLSASQEGLWFLRQLRPDSPAYNLIYLFKMIGGVDPEILKLSLDELVRRHEILRTVYPIDKEGKPIQVIQPFESSGLIYVDFSLIEESEKEKALRAYAIEQGNKSYDLQKGPVARFNLLHTASNEDYFLLAVHHISFDEWSRFVFIQDLLQLYEAYRSGNEPNLPSFPIQYADYVLWETKWLNGETRATYLQHWKNILSGDLPILALSTDHPRQTKQAHHAVRYYFELPPSISAKLRKFSTKEGLTRFQVLLSAYAVLLQRYTGQEDIIIGCPFANRPLPEQDGMIGNFVNTLPIRLNLGGNPDVRNLLKQVHEAMVDASTWKTLPFEALVAELAPQRDLGRAPIYQATINMLNMPRRQKSIPGLEIDLYFREQMLGDYDISIEFSDSGDHFTACLLYSTDFFDHSTMVRMASHFQNILGEILDKPARPLFELEILSVEEKQQILVEWNDTATSYPREKCIHQLFEKQVEHSPETVAVILDDKKITYRELNARANQLSHYLHSLGVGPNVLVGICMERSIEMIIGLIGILKAGGAYMPLDPEYPPERIDFMLEDSQVSFLVTQSHIENKLPSFSKKVVCFDTDGEIISQQRDDNLSTTVQPDDLAYVIYTSGSTGKPKGVLVSNYNVVRLFQATHDWFKFDGNDVWTFFHSLAFDFSVWEIWGALLYGGKLVVVPYLVSRSPVAFLELLCRNHVTVLNQTPSAFYQLIQAEENAGKKNLMLRLIILGGEALNFENLKPWFERHGDEHPALVNMYGITETCVHVTYRPLSKSDLDLGAVSAIGVPIPDLQIYLLDSHGQVVPVGVPGEIYVGGAGLARGYLNRPDLTANKFLLNPFSAETGGWLYKSGDLARWWPDGQLEYLGRGDEQIKLRGYRIELGEIETAINQYPGIQQVFVMVREDRPGDKRLVAYIIPVSNNALVVNELREFLQEKLPAYMIPSAFVLLKAFPLTINGKIDRKALPTSEMALANNLDYVAPNSPTEQTLSEIWMKVLGIPRISTEDDFFFIGGNSLLAIQVIMLIRRELGIGVPVQRIFKFPRLSELAAQIDFELLYQGQSSGSQNDPNDLEEHIL